MVAARKALSETANIQALTHGALEGFTSKLVAAYSAGAISEPTMKEILAHIIAYQIKEKIESRLNQRTSLISARLSKRLSTIETRYYER